MFVCFMIICCFFICVFSLAVVFAVSFARRIVLLVFAQINKNLKPTKTYKNLQEPAQICKNTDIYINTQ